MIDLINEILATIRHNKLRTALTGFAVSWGIFMLLILLSLTQGLVNNMNTWFASRDNEVISIRGGYAQKAFQGLKENRRIKLKDTDMEVIRSQNGGTVAEVSAELSNSSALISSPKDYVDVGYVGVYPSIVAEQGLKIAKGRGINHNDLAQQRRVVFLAQESATILFGEKDPVGQRVKIGDLSFTVIGTYDSEWNTNAYIPYTTAKALSGNSGDVDRLQVKIKNINTADKSDEAEQAYRATLGRLHTFAADDDGALWIWNRFSDYMRQNTAQSAVLTAMWIIGLLTMLSGIVGVSNIMFVSVRERTHEIGVRRAIGAKPRSILRQIILESVAITTLFGYIGVVMGVLVTEAVNHYLKDMPDAVLKDPTVDLGLAAQVTVVLIIAGALAGLFPAIKSLKIKPVEALRDE